MIFSVGSNLLDACVLSILTGGDTYGYKLTQELQEVVPISDSTLYPVLRRLRKQDFLTSYNVEYEGRNRRYYKITGKGLEQHAKNIAEWKNSRDILDKVFK